MLVVWRHGGSLVLAPYAAETRVGLQPQTSDDSVTLQKRSWREDRWVEGGQELTRSLIRDDWERRSEKSMAVSGRGTMPVNKSSATKMMFFSLHNRRRKFDCAQILGNINTDKNKRLRGQIQFIRFFTELSDRV